MKRFVITMSVILLISAGAFWLISVPHPWQTELFRYALFGVFLGISFMLALYHLFLYAFVARERAYLLFAGTCVVMLLRFTLLDNGLISLLPVAYPAFLYPVCASLLTVHAAFGVWFSHEALQLPMGKVRGILYGVCFGISILGPFFISRPYYLVFGVVPIIMTVVAALKTPRVRGNPYRVAYVAGLAFFVLFTAIGVAEPFKDLFIVGVFPWLFFFLTQAVLLSVEFSETRQREREMAESNALLENLSRVKSEFFSNISHEIKTPLTVIATDVALTGRYIQRGEYDEALALLDNAQAEVLHTADFVTDALRFARNQEVSSTMERFDFGAVIKTTLAVFEPFARVRDNALQGTNGAALEVYGNADLLGSAMVNLLTNANNHTKGGVIRVEGAAHEGGVRVTVSDNGSGITEELLPSVFERGVTDGGGTGLGLAIVRSIIEQHGGGIWIESEYGAGTRVTFTLPGAKEVAP